MNYIKHILLTLLIWLLCHVILVPTPEKFTSVSAQAFCALRQPHRAQQKLFPTSTRLQAFTNQVTDHHRKSIQKRLSFSIHPNELGLHTFFFSW